MEMLLIVARLFFAYQANVILRKFGAVHEILRYLVVIIGGVDFFSQPAAYLLPAAAELTAYGYYSVRMLRLL